MVKKANMFSISLRIKETQIKTPRKHKPIRMTTLKKTDNFKFYQGSFSNGNSHSVLVGTQIVSSTLENGRIYKTELFNIL